MNHHHIDRRVARSAECSTAGRSPTEPEVIEAMVRKARALGVTVFLKRDLERMEAFERVVVEGVHARICQRNGGQR